MSLRKLFQGLMLIVFGSASLLIVSACADRGKDLAQPKNWQTTTTRPPPPTSAPDSQESASGLNLTSPAFSPGDNIPIDATCEGANQLPVLQWDDASGTSVELVLTLTNQTDPENPDLVWLMAGLDPSLTELDYANLPEVYLEGSNAWGSVGFGSPCLDNISEVQTELQFRLHVLDQDSEINTSDSATESWNRLQALTVESASLLARLDNTP